MLQPEACSPPADCTRSVPMTISSTSCSVLECIRLSASPNSLRGCANNFADNPLYSDLGAHKR